jgi:sterol desaturase/sphingolipid hydroxylase (fatty acid hydroxylase superfamily)
VSELYLLVVGCLAADTALLGALVWAYHSPRFAAHRISRAAPMQVAFAHRARTMSVTSALSLATVGGVTYLFYERLFRTDEVPWWTSVLEAAAILLVYDFAYYFVHRAMHHPVLLRHVHGVHHRARNPSALESFYQHPLELLAGLFLLFWSTWLVGPVSVRGFALTFLVYSTLNILVHSGLDSKTAILAPIDFLTRKHHAHHLRDPRRNYSSLTPLPDLLFGTSL